jgi:hypothetical protein
VEHLDPPSTIENHTPMRGAAQRLEGKKKKKSHPSAALERWLAETRKDEPFRPVSADPNEEKVEAGV